MTKWVEGLEVTYKGKHGYIKFIDELYLTICVHPSEGRKTFGDICIVVYPDDWDKIVIPRHSTK